VVAEREALEKRAVAKEVDEDAKKLRAEKKAATKREKAALREAAEKEAVEMRVAAKRKLNERAAAYSTTYAKAAVAQKRNKKKEVVSQAANAFIHIEEKHTAKDTAGDFILESNIKNKGRILRLGSNVVAAKEVFCHF
jgi:hypothetical protein